MKFVVTIEEHRKQGSDWKVRGTREYMVRFPNYQSPDITQLYNNVKAKVEKDLGKCRFVAKGYHLYADSALTLGERSQLDLEGEIKYPPIPVSL